MNRCIKKLALDFRPATTAMLLATLGGVGSAQTPTAQNPTWKEGPLLLQDDPDCAFLLTCLATLSGEKDMIAADLDCDGDQDVLIARKEVNTLLPLSNLLLMNDNGNLVDVTAVYTTFLTDAPRVTRDVQVIDANADGWPDVVFANTKVNPPDAITQQPRLYINLGETGGAWQGFDEVPLDEWLDFFQYPSGLPIDDMQPSPQFCGVAIGDVDGDGLDDMFFVDYTNTLGHRLLMNVTVPGSRDLRFEDRTDDPNGAFGAFTGNAFLSDLDKLDIGLQLDPMDPTAFTAAVDMADFDADASPDNDSLDLVYWQSLGQARIVLNDNAGGFDAFADSGGAMQYAGAVVDYNQDGWPDLYTVDDNCDVLNANMTTVDPISLPDLDHPNFPQPGGIIDRAVTRAPGGCTHAADLDRDGFPDVAVSDLDVQDLPGDCIANSGGVLFHVLLNTTPAPPAGQPFADPVECALTVHGETLVSGDCTSPSFDVQNPQPWNRDNVYDFAFLDLNQDGFQDILFGLCEGLESG